MTTPIPFIACHPSNYTKGRVVPTTGEGVIAGLAGHNFVVDSIALHRTAVKGDTALGECHYYSGPNRKASFHEAIGTDGKRCRSVNLADRAWGVVGGAFAHSVDTRIANYRSYSIELCGLNGTALTPAQIVSVVQAITDAKKASMTIVLQKITNADLAVGRAGLYDHRQATQAFKVESGHQDFILDSDWALILKGLSVATIKL